MFLRFFILIVFVSNFLFSQTSNVDTTKNAIQNFYLNEDSLITAIVSNPDTIFNSQKSVFGATIASAIIPGTGQIYNGSYWKTPVVLGFFYYFGNIVVSQNNLYEQHRDLYIKSISTNNPFGDLNEKRYRDFYRSQRDEFAWYLFITYFINVLDAYVDSNLSNFEVNSDLNTGAVKLNWKINLK